MKKTDLRELLNANKALLPYTERVAKQNLSPHSVELHLSSFCNYNCSHCSYQERRKAGMRVSDEKISMLVEDLITLKPKGIYWSGGGEPTTIKNLPQFMEQVADSDIEQALVTNALLLNDRHMAVLPKFNYIAVSFQASNPDTYREITGCDTRDQLYENVKKLREILSTTILGARSVINRQNYKQIVDMLHDAKDLGFDYIIFIPAVDYEGSGDIELTDEQKDFLRAEVQRIDAEVDDNYTNLRKVISRGIAHYNKEDSVSMPCHSNEMRATAFVNYDSGVWLCQPHIGNEKYQIGSLEDQRFIKIWNSERHKEVIELLNKEHMANRCNSCRSIGYNKAIHSYITNNEGELFFDPFL